MLKGIGAGAMMSAITGVQSLGQATVGFTTKASSGVVFELLTYHANEGKKDDLLSRFRDQTNTIIKRHHMESVAYWTPTDDPLSGRTLVYILKHPNREAATANWAAFHDDPEWKQVSAASEVNGKLVAKVESVFMKLTDFSPQV